MGRAIAIANEKAWQHKEAACIKIGIVNLKKSWFSNVSEREHFLWINKGDLERIALSLAIKNYLKHPFRDQVAGQKWLELFLRQHKGQLSMQN